MAAVGKGALLEKSKTSHCVINIIPPRYTWTQMQVYRNRNTKDARCGPHFSFIDPFVTIENYPEAARLLKEHLADFPPFEVALEKFGSFNFSKTSALYLEPTFNPPNALQNLLKKIEEVFPQCNDQVLKSKSGVYVPHMTIGTYKNKTEVERAIEEIKKDFIPIRFTVNEIYLLHREGYDPFEASYIIPFLGSHAPSFGPGCEDEIFDSKANKTIVVMGIPTSLDNSSLAKVFVDLGFNVTGAEIILNPDHKPRPLGVVEFTSRKEAEKALETINNKNGAASILSASVYSKLLINMVFPDVVGGSCSH